MGYEVPGLGSHAVVAALVVVTNLAPMAGLDGLADYTGAAACALTTGSTMQDSACRAGAPATVLPGLQPPLFLQEPLRSVQLRLPVQRRASQCRRAMPAPFELVITAEDLQQRNLAGAENGRPTRLVSAGSTGTVTVAGNGQSISFPSRGVGQTTVTEGDVTTVATGGQLLLALFPTDVPAGPSTTLYTGRVVFTIDNLTGVFTLQKAAGRQVNVCSALGG
jgi:hypothetical protein